MMTPLLRRLSPALALLLLCLSAGCEDDMADQARYEPLEGSVLFQDGMASRPIPAGTVARGHLRTDTHLYEGSVNGQYATDFPFPITEDWLKRGQQRYEIFCAPCHGSLGDGNGMIVQRGMTRPPAFYPIPEQAQQFPQLHARSQYLLDAPVGHYFYVISNGWGAMFSYNDRVRPEDRWAIIMYIRALQLSQHAPAEAVPAEQRQQVGSTTRKQLMQHAQQRGQPQETPVRPEHRTERPAPEDNR